MGSAPRPTKTPIVVVGGGPVGLSASILLSLNKIPHHLFERHASTSIHPKAVGWNQRTMEIFRLMGIEDEIYAVAGPVEIHRTAWYTALGEQGHEIASRDSWGGGEYAAEYAGYSTCRYSLLPQIRMEPILRKRADGLNPDGVHYGCEVLTVDDEGDRALVKVLNRDSKTESIYEARYVIVADGGRQFTDALGIKWLGQKNIFDMVTAHFRAPLRSLHPDPTILLTWFTNPDMGGATRTGYLYQVGPWPLSNLEPKNEEWVFVCGLINSDPKAFDEEKMLGRLRRTIGIPDLPAEIMSFSHWNVNATYAERYRHGKLFLAGDAAHRIPPWGALGANTGVQDVHNLAWKLALALKDESKYDKLLDTYEAERQAVGKSVGEISFTNMFAHAGTMDAALGIAAEKTAEENWKAAAGFINPEHEEYAAKRAAVQEAQRSMDIEFKAPAYEIGHFYPSADINGEGGKTHGGQLNADGSIHHQHYMPTTIPGHHLPHVWLEKDGERQSTRDLVVLDKMTLFVEKRQPCPEGDKQTHAVLVGEGGWTDPSSEWQRLRGVDAAGGVLVRPDNVVAWRGDLSCQSPEAWSKLIDRILKVGN